MPAPPVRYRCTRPWSLTPQDAAALKFGGYSYSTRYQRSPLDSDRAMLPYPSRRVYAHCSDCRRTFGSLRRLDRHHCLPVLTQIFEYELGLQKDESVWTKLRRLSLNDEKPAETKTKTNFLVEHTCQNSAVCMCLPDRKRYENHVKRTKKSRSKSKWNKRKASKPRSPASKSDSPIKTDFLVTHTCRNNPVCMCLPDPKKYAALHTTPTSVASRLRKMLRLSR